MSDTTTAESALNGVGESHTIAREWALAAALGVLGISLTNLIGLSSGSSGAKAGDQPIFIFIRLSEPVLVMAWYARRGYRFAKKAQAFPALRAARVGQLADSIYFLGFLWTLWALIDSFVIHQMAVAEAVFRTFGYALVTTASGMFLRLLLLQFQHSDNDIREFSEQDLAAQINRFSKVLSDTTSSVESFQGQTSTAISGWVHSLNRSTESLNQSIADVHAGSVTLQNSLEGFTQRVEAMVQASLNEFTTKMGPSFGQLNAANRRYADEVRSGTESFRTMNIQFATTLASQLKDIEAALKEVGRQINQIRVPADAVERSIQHQTSGINASLTAGIKSLESAIADVARQVRATTNSLGNAQPKRPWWKLW